MSVLNFLQQPFVCKPNLICQNFTRQYFPNSDSWKLFCNIVISRFHIANNAGQTKLCYTTYTKQGMYLTFTLSTCYLLISIYHIYSAKLWQAKLTDWGFHRIWQMTSHSSNSSVFYCQTFALYSIMVAS